MPAPVDPFPDFQPGAIADANQVDARFATLYAASPGLTPVVSVLPGAPADGQHVYLQTAAMAAVGAMFHLRYRDAATGPHKWEPVGGSPLISEVAAQQNTSSTAYTDLSTIGSVDVPVAGDYLIGQSLEAVCTATQADVSMSFAIGAAAATDDDRTTNVLDTPNVGYAWGRTFRYESLPASTLTTKFKTSAGTASIRKRVLTVTPLRVG